MILSVRYRTGTHNLEVAGSSPAPATKKVSSRPQGYRKSASLEVIGSRCLLKEKFFWLWRNCQLNLLCQSLPLSRYRLDIHTKPAGIILRVLFFFFDRTERSQKAYIACWCSTSTNPLLFRSYRTREHVVINRGGTLPSSAVASLNLKFFV